MMSARSYFFLLLICLTALRLPAQKKSILYRPFRTQLKNCTIKEVLDDINANSGVQIEYASVSFPAGRIVNPENDTRTLGALLQQMLGGQKVNAIEKNGKIILTPSSVPLADDALLPLYFFFGIVAEENSREPLHEAVIYEASTHKAVTTNVHGYFSIQLPEGHHRLEISYAGYRLRGLDVDLRSDLRSDVFMTRKEDIAEVIVSADDGLRKNAADKVLPGQYDAYNNFLGENDALRSLYVLPGVMNVTDASNALLVRGGEQDGNLFLLDGNPVFNPTHMLGALSIVNRTSMKSMQLFKNDFPSRYGGRLSAVIDVHTKDGKMEKWGGEANLNFLAGSFTIEGPLKKNKTALMLSFRHSMFNSLLNLFQKDFSNNFYDIQFKCTHLLDKNNKLMLNIYTGIDNLNMQVNDNNLNNRQHWGNRIASLGWTHLISTNTFITTTLSISNYYNLAGFIYTGYDDSTGEPVTRRSFNTYSSLGHYAARTQGEMRLTNTTRLNFGAEFTYTSIKPFESRIDSTITIDPGSFQSHAPLPFRETKLYAEIEMNVGKRLLLRPGMHFSKYRFKDYRYTSFQPRLYAVYKLNATGQIYASYSRMTQYLHLLANPFLGVNCDTWVPSTGLLNPEGSKSIDLGYSYRGRKNISFSIGAYWKKMYNVTNYTEGKSFFINTDSIWEQNVQTGKGWSYGLEFAGDKAGRKLSVHIGYALSWNWRQFDQINQGKKFPFKYDRRHNLNIALTYKADKSKDISLLWMIASGDVFTLPKKIYPDYDNAQQISSPNDALKNYRFIYHFSGVNDYRTQPYHRLDLSASYHPPHKKRVGFKWTVGVYNVYGSPGQYSYGLEGTLRNKSLVIVTKDQLFNITPYLSSTVDF